MSIVEAGAAISMLECLRHDTFEYTDTSYISPTSSQFDRLAVYQSHNVHQEVIRVDNSKVIFTISTNLLDGLWHSAFRRLLSHEVSHSRHLIFR